MFLKVVFLTIFGLLLVGCNDSSNNSSSTQISITPSDQYNTIAANISETQTYTYTIKPSNTYAATYSVDVSNLPSGVSISSNGCKNIQTSSSCQIVLAFAPTSINNFNTQAFVTFIYTDGNNTSNTQNYPLSLSPRSISLQTYPYGSNKSYFNVNIGNGSTAFAEIDTGSQLIVADFNMTVSGANNVTATYGTNGKIQVISNEGNKTCYNLIVAQYANGNISNTTNLQNNCSSILYGNGTRPVYGFYATGSFTITATDGYTATVKNVPMFISNNINNGNSGSDATNNVIFGLNMDSQVSAKNFLQYPLNQMLVVNKPNSTITFGLLNQNQLNGFQLTNLSALPVTSCATAGYTSIDSNVTCWNSQAIPLTFSFATSASDRYCTTSVQVGSSSSGSNIAPSLFDSGAGSASFQYPIYPNSGYLSWAVCRNSNHQSITSITGVSLGNYSINLPSAINYEQNATAPKVNIGNAIFSQYQILFNQKDGSIGLSNP